jgi:hypothetical protein
VLRFFSCLFSLRVVLCAPSLVLMLAGPPAAAFDYARYQAADLDELLARKRPSSGVDLYPGIPLKLTLALVAYGEPCQTGMLLKSMTVAGFANPVKISRCIRVRSARGQQFRLFIQDQVSDFLPKEVPLGTTLTWFVVHMFTSTDGPGLLVNEFEAMASPAKPI